MVNKYQKKYQEIEKDGLKRAEQVAMQAYQEIEDVLHIHFEFDSGVDAQNKLLALLGTKHQKEILPILKKYNYNTRAELFYVIANLCHRYSLENMQQYVAYPTLKAISYTSVGYVVDTIYGKATIYRIKDLIPEFSSYCIPDECHYVAEQFIRDYYDVTASTVLMDQLFASKKYHSIVNYEDMVIDFPNNACMLKENYNRLFAPKAINTVDGEHIDAELENVSKKENLGMDKSHLLVLALDKQVE